MVVVDLERLLKRHSTPSFLGLARTGSARDSALTCSFRSSCKKIKYTTARSSRTFRFGRCCFSIFEGRSFQKDSPRCYANLRLMQLMRSRPGAEEFERSHDYWKKLPQQSSRALDLEDQVQGLLTARPQSPGLPSKLQTPQLM